MTKITSEQALVELTKGKINSKQALFELTQGKELEWQLKGEWVPMNSIVNPISEPNKMWRVKKAEWEEAYEKWTGGDIYEYGQHDGFKAGWNAAMEVNKPKKP